MITHAPNTTTAVRTSATSTLCCRFFLDFMMRTIAASIVTCQLRLTVPLPRHQHVQIMRLPLQGSSLFGTKLNTEMTPLKEQRTTSMNFLLEQLSSRALIREVQRMQMSTVRTTRILTISHDCHMVAFYRNTGHFQMSGFSFGFSFIFFYLRLSPVSLIELGFFFPPKMCKMRLQLQAQVGA